MNRLRILDSKQNTKELYPFFYFLLFLSILVYSAPSIDARVEVAYDSEYFTDDTFVLGEDTYSVSVLSSGETVMISYPGGSSLIDFEECGSLSDSSVEVCFYDNGYDDSKGEHYAHLEVSMLYPDISISQELSAHTLRPGEELEVNSTISNKGNATAGNLVFTQELPSEVDVLDAGELTHDDNFLSWSSSLDDGENKTFSYTMSAQSAMSFSLQPFIDYDDGFEMQTTYAESADVSVESPFSMNLESNTTDEIEVGDRIRFKVNVSNDDQDDAGLDLSLDIPEKMHIELRDSRLVRDGQQLDYDGSIDSESHMTFELVLIAADPGLAEPEVEARFHQDDYTIFDESPSFDILERDLDLDLRFSKMTDQGREFEKLDDGHKFEGSSSGRLDLYVRNNYPDEIEDVRVEMTSDYINLTQMRESIPGQSSRLAFKSDMDVPFVNTTMDDDILVNVSYTTSFGYQSHHALELTFTYEPLEQIEVEHEITPEKPESGDEVSVSVVTTNPRMSDLEDVHFRDRVADDLYRFGTRERTLDLTPEENRDVYEYILELPVVSEKREISLFTEVKYSDSLGDHDYKIPFSFKVHPREPEFEISREVEDVRKGRTTSVDYSLTNQEDYRFEDVVLKVSGGSGIYLSDGPEVEVDFGHVNPGQTVTPDEGKNFMAFSDSASLGESTLMFTDDQGVRHEIDISSLDLDVIDEDISMPGLSLSLVDVESENDKNFSYSIEVENTGDESVRFILFDKENETEHFLGSDSSTLFDRQDFFSDYPDMILQAPYIQFNYEGNELYALTDNFDLENIYEEEEDVEIIDDSEENDSIDDIDDADTIDEESLDDEDDSLGDNSDDVEDEDTGSEADGDDGSRDDNEDDNGDEDLGFFAGILDSLLRLLGIRG